MTELNKSAPTQAEMDQLLDPDYLSGRQRDALKRLDEKNVDRSDLMELFAGALEAYKAARDADD